MKGFFIPIFLVCTIQVTAQPKKSPPPQKLPIIDMHLHAVRANAYGPPPIQFCLPVAELPMMDQQRPYPEQFLEQLMSNGSCKIKVVSPLTDEEVFTRTVAMMKKYNMYGVASGSQILNWIKKEPDLFMAGLSFNINRDKYSPDSLRTRLKTGTYKILGEVGHQYNGILPTDSIFDRYVAVAEELDIPMGIHMGPGPYGAAYLQYPKMRARDHSPLLLEELLVKHPKLRVYIMHAGWPMIDDLIALLYQHPQVYVDIAAINWVLPKKEFHRFLQRIVEAGYGKRVMFGSDQMVWPESIDVAIESIETATFLTTQQKRDIFYNNAARFLQLSEAEIKRHHGK